MAETETKTRDADSVIDFFKEQSTLKRAINPEWWMDAALSLNLFLIDEEAILHEMRRKVSEQIVSLLDKQEKRNVSEAELRVQALPEYRDMKIQQSRCDRINEFILLAKKNASTANNFIN